MTAPARSETVAAAVLAGGRAQRLGGIDKGLAPWHGRPLIAHVVDLLRSDFDSVLIIANRHHDLYRAYGRVRADAREGYRGPLEGIATALRETSADWLFVVPVDSPCFGADLFARLWRGRGDATVVVAHDGARRQPLFALYRRARLELPEDAADMPVWCWQDTHALREVDFGDSPERFANLNTAEDFLDARS
ncbi:MAG TPA: molybdenum cofactor guanylyltransferase MobA [Tahibacter sp.]|uniref:molybdenum cofactor guanylyltransferase MobA n=1 Tax=Tahibacter sp. TaxID=2056211 RepID=UPI002CE54F6C|nr:molybdenum cofactor guanylyltransferase MobA [Tahibacter sp.]HSX61706.1 molybdenum cofactor guanylyltransferase MobA [Tahibacter sp.]